MKERIFPQIVNGVEVDPPGKYPYIVYLDDCGGSLIAPNTILTAAHCGDQLTAVIGIHDISNTTEEREYFSISQKVIHPKYDDDTLDYDFMLLRIDNSSKFKPVKLGSNYTSAKTELVTMGYGLLLDEGEYVPLVLQETEVDALSNSECAQMYSEPIPDNMICAGRTTDGISFDACNGDGGGPLINKETGVQVGVVSWGYGCANPNYPGVYSRVSSQYDWMESIMKDFNCVSDKDCIRGVSCYIGHCESGMCEYRSNPENSIEIEMELVTDEYAESMWMIEISPMLQVARGGPYDLGKTSYVHNERLCLRDRHTFIMKYLGEDRYYQLSINNETVISGRSSGENYDFQLCQTDEDCTDTSISCSIGRCNSNICKYELDKNKSGIVTVEVKTDNYPKETSWYVYIDSNDYMVGDGYTEPNYIYSSTKRLCHDTYEFEIFDEYGDGICCHSSLTNSQKHNLRYGKKENNVFEATGGDGYYNVYVNGEKVGTGGLFQSHAAFNFTVI